MHIRSARWKLRDGDSSVRSGESRVQNWISAFDLADGGFEIGIRVFDLPDQGFKTEFERSNRQMEASKPGFEYSICRMKGSKLDCASDLTDGRFRNWNRAFDLPDRGIKTRFERST